MKGRKPITERDLELMLERLTMAASVTIEADKARELARLALLGLSIDDGASAYEFEEEEWQP